MVPLLDPAQAPGNPPTGGGGDPFLAAGLSALLYALPDPVWVKDIHGVYRACNRRFEVQVGLESAAIIGRTDFDLVPPSQAARFLASDQTVITSGQPTRYNEQVTFAYDGHKEYLETVKTPVFDEVGAVIGVLGIGRDLSARVRDEAALRDQKDRLQRAESVARFGHWELEVDTARIRASLGAHRIYGLEPGPLGLAEVRGLVLEEDRAGMEAALRDLIGKGEPYSVEFRILRRDGEVRTLQSVAEFDPGRRTVFGVIHDCTERAKLSAQLQQAQKMDSLGSLAGGVAHDMNNVLGAILALASAHLGQEPGDSPLAQSLRTICEAAARGGTMVKRLLNFARLDPSEAQVFELNPVLEEHARLLAQTTLAQVKLDWHLAPDLHPIQGDAGALANAFMNLCVNAVDAMAEGGTLRLETRNAEPGWIEIRLADTGCGMTPAVLEKAMDPFFTTKEVGKGTGLGLAMVYSTVKAHHGTLALESEPGQGTRVTVRLPAAATALPAPCSGPAVPVGAGRALRVLLVDDDELIRKATGTLIGFSGHQLTLASSGEEALAVLDQGYRPEVIILDMNMPGLGGKGTLPELRRRCPETPVLVATGRADQGVLDLVAAHAKVHLLPKPFQAEELLQWLASV